MRSFLELPRAEIRACGQKKSKMEYSRDDELEYSITVNTKLFAEESGQKVTDQTAHRRQEQSDIALLCFNLFFLFICSSFNIQRAKERFFY